MQPSRPRKRVLPDAEERGVSCYLCPYADLPGPGRGCLECDAYKKRPTIQRDNGTPEEKG